MQIRIMAVIGMIGIAASLQAQQASNTLAPTPTAPASSVPASASEPAPPSADFLKQARMAGYRSKVKNGVYLFCKTDASLGSRLPSEKCFDQNALSTMLERTQAQRDQIQHGLGCAGGVTCGGSK